MNVQVSNSENVPVHPLFTDNRRISSHKLSEGTMYGLTGFQRDLLSVIAGLDEPHGLAIKEDLEDYYEKEIHHGRFYPNLDALVEKGVVEKGEKNRRTNTYTLTHRGQREIAARREWEQQYSELEGSAPA